MITRRQCQAAKEKAAEMIRRAGIVVTEQEVAGIEVADFGLSNLDTEGAQMLTLVATDRFGAKLLVLLPNQTLPEHWHPPVGDDPGKEETVRVIAGTMYCHVPGPETVREGSIPQGKGDCYTARQAIVMKPGDQLTLEPGRKHWLRAGEEGAVGYSFSTTVRDILDEFTDPAIERVTEVSDQ